MKLDEQATELLIQLWNDAAVRVGIIAERFDVPAHAIRHKAKRLGLPNKPQGPRYNEWSDAKKSLLTSLWVKGGLSASEIGSRMGMTRNAVLGMVYRMNLPSRAPQRASHTPRPRKIKPSTSKHEDITYIAARIKARLETKSEPEPLPEDQDRTDLIGIMALTKTTCRWPIGTPVRYCGRDCPLDSPYCSEHHKRAYQAVQVRRKIHPNYSAKRGVA